MKTNIDKLYLYVCFHTQSFYQLVYLHKMYNEKKIKIDLLMKGSK